MHIVHNTNLGTSLYLEHKVRGPKWEDYLPYAKIPQARVWEPSQASRLESSLNSKAPWAPTTYMHTLTTKEAIPTSSIKNEWLYMEFSLQRNLLTKWAQPLKWKELWWKMQGQRKKKRGEEGGKLSLSWCYSIQSCLCPMRKREGRWSSKGWVAGN